MTNRITSWNFTPFIVVLLCALLEPLLMNNLTQKLNLPSNPLFFGLTQVVIGIWIIIIWILLALIPHLFSLLFDSKGNFKNLLSEVGYGFIPMLIGIGISFFLIDELVLPQTLDLGILENNSTIKLISLINLISMTLTIPWVIYCLHKLYEIKLVHSAISVIVPFSIIYLGSNLIGSII